MADTQTATPPAPAVAPTETTPVEQPPSTSPAAPTGPAFLGDDLLADAEMVYDQRRTIKGAPEDIWPWIVQWGKGRGGWYVPAKFEKVLPEKFRSAPTINPAWQDLSVGDRVPDYGFGATKDKKKQKKEKKAGDDDDNNNKKDTEGHLEVALVENQRALVYKGERRGITFTWALLLEDPNGNPVSSSGSSAHSGGSANETVLHFRFRGKSQQSGWKGKVALQVGKVADGMMASAMFPGIVDRVEQQEKKEKVPDAAAAAAPAPAVE